MKDDFSGGRTILGLLDVVAWILIVSAITVAAYIYGNGGSGSHALATALPLAVGGIAIMLGAILGRAQIATAENTDRIAEAAEAILKVRSQVRSESEDGS